MPGKKKKKREVARAKAGSSGKIAIIGPEGTKVKRLRQAVCGAGVDWALVRL